MTRVVVPIGPQHPALKEPASFTLYLEGEKVAATNVALGYNHRGIEKACEERPYIQDIYLIERICGICSHSHSTAFIQAVEEIAALEVPRRGAYIRSIVGERKGSTVISSGSASPVMNSVSIRCSCTRWRDREVVMDLLAMITGNRVNYGINTIGGVRRDISKEQAEQTLKAIDTRGKNEVLHKSCHRRDPHYRQARRRRSSQENGVKFGASGPTARDAGVKRTSGKTILTRLTRK